LIIIYMEYLLVNLKLCLKGVAADYVQPYSCLLRWQAAE
jgi:hypothetical protein